MAGVDDLCLAWWKSNTDKADKFKALEDYLKTFEKSLKAAQKKDDAGEWNQRRPHATPTPYRGAHNPRGARS